MALKIEYISYIYNRSRIAMVDGVDGPPTPPAADSSLRAKAKPDHAKVKQKKATEKATEKEKEKEEEKAATKEVEPAEKKNKPTNVEMTVETDKEVEKRDDKEIHTTDDSTKGVNELLHDYVEKSMIPKDEEQFSSLVNALIAAQKKREVFENMQMGQEELRSKYIMVVQIDKMMEDAKARLGVIEMLENMNMWREDRQVGATTAKATKTVETQTPDDVDPTPMIATDLPQLQHPLPVLVVQIQNPPNPRLSSVYIPVPHPMVPSNGPKPPPGPPPDHLRQQHDEAEVEEAEPKVNTEGDQDGGELEAEDEEADWNEWNDWTDGSSWWDEYGGDGEWRFSRPPRPTAPPVNVPPPTRKEGKIIYPKSMPST